MYVSSTSELVFHPTAHQTHFVSFNESAFYLCNFGCSELRHSHWDVQCVNEQVNVSLRAELFLKVKKSQ